MAAQHATGFLKLVQDAKTRVRECNVQDVKRRLEAGTVTLIDLEYSKLYRNGHIPGAWFATRTRLRAALAKLPPAESIVITSPDGDLAHVAAAELARTTQPMDAREAVERGLVTFAPDEIDWDDEIRVAVEERTSLSPDAAADEGLLVCPDPLCHKTKFPFTARANTT